MEPKRYRITMSMEVDVDPEALEDSGELENYGTMKGVFEANIFGGVETTAEDFLTYVEDEERVTAVMEIFPTLPKRNAG